MLVGIILIACVIAWCLIQKSMVDQGIEPVSRGRLRSQRKRAEQQNIDKVRARYAKDLERAMQGKPPLKPRRRR